MNTCNNGHIAVFYQAEDCPVCAKNKEIEQILDDREDIDEDNIFQLYKELRLINKRLGKVEKVVLPKTKKVLFPWHPLHYAHLVHTSRAGATVRALQNAVQVIEQSKTDEPVPAQQPPKEATF